MNPDCGKLNMLRDYLFKNIHIKGLFYVSIGVYSFTYFLNFSIGRKEENRNMTNIRILFHYKYCLFTANFRYPKPPVAVFLYRRLLLRKPFRFYNGMSGRG